MNSREKMGHCVVTGANGLVGKEVIALLRARGIPYSGYVFSRAQSGLAPLNILDFDKTREEILRVRPKVLFHCANRAGGVNRCEQEKNSAKQFHLDATANLAKAAAAVGSKFVFISTDYVFDDHDSPVSESEAAHPLNFYGQLKLDAENWLRANCPDHLAVRTTNIYGWDPDTKTPNYVMQIYRALAKGEKVRAASNLWGTPTYAKDLALALVELARQDKKGTYHFVGPDYINRFEWACDVAKKLGLNTQLIEEFQAPNDAVKRPLKLRLSTKKFDEDMDLPRRSLKMALEDMSKEIGANS